MFWRPKTYYWYSRKLRLSEFDIGSHYLFSITLTKSKFSVLFQGD